MTCKRAKHPRRSGFSLLELEVALVLFGIALSGVVPLVVIQSKQLKCLERRFRHETTHYLVPPTNLWAAKLGAAASISTELPAPSPSPAATLIDDGDPGYAETGTSWHTNNRDDAYHGDQRCSHTSGSVATAAWEFTSVEPGWYQVLVTWSPRAGQAADAPYTLYDGELEKGTTRVDQSIAPAGANFDGSPWQSLGTFLISSNVVRVMLTHEAGQTCPVKADAARIVRVKNALQLLSLEKSLTGEDVTGHVSVTVRIPP
jgi:prepilin-type N-terminal cleavage/methylation domain-containing protein